MNYLYYLNVIFTTLTHQGFKRDLHKILFQYLSKYAGWRLWANTCTWPQDKECIYSKLGQRMWFEDTSQTFGVYSLDPSPRPVIYIFHPYVSMWFLKLYTWSCFVRFQHWRVTRPLCCAVCVVALAGICLQQICNKFKSMSSSMSTTGGPQCSHKGFLLKFISFLTCFISFDPLFQKVQ